MSKFVDFASDPEEVWDLFPTYEGDLAFDIGANGGMLSRIFAPNFNTVVAFEPCRDSFDVLTADCPPNVVPVPFALADDPGRLTLEETDLVSSWGELKLGNSMERIWGGTTGKRTVPAWTADLAAQVFGWPDFVKIDTEGSEWLIVQGATAVFTRKPRFVIEVHSQANGDRILDRLGHIYRDGIQVVYHPAYKHDSPLRVNHFYLVGTP